MHGGISTGNRRARAVVGLAVLAAVSIPTAVVGSTASTGGRGATAAQEPGGTVVYGSSTELQSMDPVRLGFGRTGEDRGMMVYDSLFALDADGALVPRLALSIESEDAIVWTMKLREGVKFTDGTPFDANAVIFNVNRQLDPNNRFTGLATIEGITAMEAVDDLTVEFSLAAPSGSFPIAFASLSGFMGSPTAIEADPEGFASSPVGAGPFMVEEWVRDDHMTLVRNPDFWEPGRPYLDGITLQIVPDPPTRQRAFEAGQLDIAAVEEILSASPAVIEAVRGASGAAMVVPNHSREPGSDIRVREALNLAFDPAATNQALLHGAWEAEDLVCPPFSPESAICVDYAADFDLDRARELVAEYVADGGSPDVTFTTVVGLASTEYIQQVLQSIGFNVTIRAVPGAEVLPIMNGGDFQLAWSGNSSFASPFPRIFQFYYSGARNVPKHDIPELDDALLRARDELTEEGRNAAWREVQEILAENFVVAYYAPYFAGYVKNDHVSFGEQPGGTAANQILWSEISQTGS